MSASLAEAQDHNASTDVYLRHAGLIAEAKRKHDETGMALARVKKDAKADAVDLDAHKMIEKLTKLDYDQQVVILRRFTDYGNALEMASFKQLSLFSQPAPAPARPHPGVTVWAAGEAGLKAGRLGQPASDCPFETGSQHYAAWTDKHHTGLAERMRAEGMGDEAEDEPVIEAPPKARRGRRPNGSGAARSERADIPPIH